MLSWLTDAPALTSLSEPSALFPSNRRLIPPGVCSFFGKTGYFLLLSPQSVVYCAQLLYASSPPGDVRATSDRKEIVL